MGNRRDKVKRALRKTAKWGGTGLTVLLVVVWIGSGWWRLSWTYATRPCDTTLSVGSGVLAIRRVTYDSRVLFLPEEPLQLSLSASVPLLERWHWRPAIWSIGTRGGTGFLSLFIPLWIPMLMLTAPLWWLWHLDRRARPGSCQSCGYDRAGLRQVAVCPECGATAPPPQS
jgi:hypothetical protein